MRFRALLLLALATAATASGLAASTPAPKTAPSVLPWIDDDYARALSEAKRKKIPIFAELWAPWCHTCRSMQASTSAACCAVFRKMHSSSSPTAPRSH